MRPRSLLVALTALVAATVGLVVAPPAGAASGPSGVQITTTLLSNGDYRIASTGHAPRGARVYLQDRHNEHQLWATQEMSRATSDGAFRLTITTGRSDGSYRVCLARPGQDACSPGRTPRIVKRQGKITLAHTAAQLVPYETRVIAEGKLSRVLRDRPDLKAEYFDPLSGKWLVIPSAEVTTLDHGRFRVDVGSEFPGLTSQQGQRLRVLVRGNAYLRNAAHEWRTDSYAQRPLASLPVAAGSRTPGDIVYGFLIGSPVTSSAVSPTNTVTLTIPPGCGRVQAGVSQDLTQSGLGPYAASVARNGATAWTYDSTAPGANTFSVDVSGGDTLTLAVTFDPAHTEWRPWFVSPFQPLSTAPKQPFALCSAP